jgi:hypothetical protein
MKQAMPDELVTIASFDDPVQANLARNRLGADGIEAILTDTNTIAMTWLLSNAVGGIKIQVVAKDVGAAEGILDRSPESELEPGSSVDMPETLRPGDSPTADPEAGPEIEVEDEDEDEEEELAPTERELNAERAFRGAVLGILFRPIQLYVFYLLLRVFVSEERLEARPRHRAIVAAIVNLPFILGLCVFLRIALAGR